MSQVFPWFRVGSTKITLPVYDPETPVGTGPSVDRTMRTLGGFYDPDGASIADLELPYTLPLRGIMSEDTTALLQTALTALAGTRGRQGVLFRSLLNGDLQTCVARVLHLPPANAEATTQPVELVFQVLSPWRGAHYVASGWLLDSGEDLDDGLYFDTSGTTLLDASPKTITVTHAGNAEITDITITVTAAGTDITALTVKVGSTWEWTGGGTITAGQSLVVDCGAQTVKNNGVDAYASFALTANHNQDHWFAFQPGSNTVTVTKTGGNASSSISFDYYEAWE